MCAHCEAVSKPERLKRAFQVAMPEAAPADVWPGYTGLFFLRPKEAVEEEGVSIWREAIVGFLGLIPHWAKDAA